MTSIVDYWIDYKAKLIKEFVEDSITTWGSHLEIAKLIYDLWPKYIKQSLWGTRYRSNAHNTILTSLYTLKEKLLEFKYGTDDEKWLYHSNNKRYHNWQIFAFFPLLEENGFLLLMKMMKLHYNDSQDMLIFGLACYPQMSWCGPERSLSYLRDILTYWDENGNIHFCRGTGSIGQLECLVKIYKNYNVNLHEIDGIKDILERYDID